MPQNTHYQAFKNALKLQLTDDSLIPFEARKAHQVLLKVSKLVNKRTG
jgi:hypothetical protein